MALVSLVSIVSMQRFAYGRRSRTSMRVPEGPSTNEIRVVGLNCRGSIVNVTAFAADLQCAVGSAEF